MKKSYLYLVILLCASSGRVVAQSPIIHDPMSFLQQANMWAWSKIANWEQTQRDVQMIKSTIELVQTYKKVQALTANIVATGQDMAQFTKSIYNDAKNMDAITKGQVDNLAQYFSFKDALSGKNGESLLGINDYYREQSSFFRDKATGNINLATFLETTISDQALIRQMPGGPNLSPTLNRSRMRMTTLDKEIAENLMLALTHEREARADMVKLRLIVGLEDAIGDISNDLKNFGKANKEEFKGKYTAADIDAIRDNIKHNMTEANRLRSEALMREQDLQNEMQPYVLAARWAAEQKWARENQFISAQEQERRRKDQQLIWEQGYNELIKGKDKYNFNLPIGSISPK